MVRPHNPFEFVPARNSMCLCGSGLRFKRCCADRLPGFSLGKVARTAFADRRFKEAILAYRADITQYTIWHKSHTEPVLRLGKPKTESLLKIDINALSELVDGLLWCHLATNQTDEFSLVLERLRHNIKDERWRRKITLFHALNALGTEWNEEAGRRELRKLGSINDEQDIETLQVYLDLFYETLSFSDRQFIIDRILSLTDSATDKIHYKGTRAIEFLFIGDTERAKADLTEAVQEARNEKHLSSHARYRLAMALELLGDMIKDDVMLDEATAIYNELLADDNLLPNGRAGLYRMLGEVKRRKEDWEEARNMYNRAYETIPSGIYHVFAAECCLQLEKPTCAIRLLDAIDTAKLEKEELVDYAFALAATAIHLNQLPLLERAEDVLRNIEVTNPYFRQRRDSLLLATIDAKVNGASLNAKQHSSGLLASIARGANKYLVLKPSFMGIGIDLNRMLDDLSKGQQKHQQESARQGNKPLDKDADKPSKRRK